MTREHKPHDTFPISISPYAGPPISAYTMCDEGHVSEHPVIAMGIFEWLIVEDGEPVGRDVDGVAHTEASLMTIGGWGGLLIPVADLPGFWCVAPAEWAPSPEDIEERRIEMFREDVNWTEHLAQLDAKETGESDE